MKPAVLRELLRLLLSTHFSGRHIAHLLQVSRRTVDRYRALVKGSSFILKELNQLSDSELQQKFNPSYSDSSEKRVPDWTHIHELMHVKHQTRIQLWEEYCRINPASAYSYSQFNKHYKDYLQTIDFSMRQTYEPGDICFVDFAGKRLSYTDSATRQNHKAEIFVGVLGYSQLIFCIATESQKQEEWIWAHEQMLMFYGGVPQLIVPDNLKSAVTKPGKDPIINRAYQEMAQHYGFVIDPARVRHPQDKSLAENGVLLVTRWITVALKRRQFFSLNEINQAIAELLPALNQRPFKRYEGSRQSRFDGAEHPTLQPLPEQSFENGTWLPSQKVPNDYHVYVYNHAYSIPYRFVGSPVEVKVSRQKVEIFHEHRLIALHPRSDTPGAATTNAEHRPPRHQAYAAQTQTYFMNWAKNCGSEVMAVVAAQFEGLSEHSLKGIRACSKLQKLHRQYGAERFKNACACVTDIQSLTVSSVRSVLQCRLDENNPAIQSLQHKLPSHSNVRGAAYYANHERGLT